MDFEEKWSSPPEEAAPGDILRRTVTLTAFGVEAERLPDLTLTGSRGAVISDHGGDRETLRSSDGILGKVTREWDIRIIDPRVAVIGSVAIEHWHPGFHRSIRAEAPAHRIEPTPTDPEARAAGLLAEAYASERVWRVTSVVALALIFLPFAGLVCLAVFTAAPTVADLRLKRSLRRSSAPADIWAAVDRWAKVSDPGAAQSVPAFAQASTTLFSCSGTRPDSHAIAAGLLAAARKRRLEKLSRRTKFWLSSLLGPKSAL